jgi:hypothetical protein
VIVVFPASTWANKAMFLILFIIENFGNKSINNNECTTAFYQTIFTVLGIKK